MRLLVTGGRSGYLGRHVVAAAAGHEVVAVGSVDADIRDRAAVDALLGAHRPDAVVHTAYVQSDWDVTATGAAHVALAATAHGARLVLVSSDAVFSGDDVHYDESAPPDPTTAYGAAKAAAETTALTVCADVVVARTSLVLGDGASQHEGSCTTWPGEQRARCSTTRDAARCTSTTSPPLWSSSPRAVTRVCSTSQVPTR